MTETNLDDTNIIQTPSASTGKDSTLTDIVLVNPSSEEVKEKTQGRKILEVRTLPDGGEMIVFDRRIGDEEEGVAKEAMTEVLGSEEMSGITGKGDLVTSIDGLGRVINGDLDKPSRNDPELSAEVDQVKIRFSKIRSQVAQMDASKRRMMDQHLKDRVTMEAIKNCPKFEKFSRRLYDIPGNIHSFKGLVSFLSFGLGPSIGMLNKYVSCKSFAAISLISSIYDFPFWVIPKHMGEVISHIDPPEKWDVKSMVMGFPSLLFLLPRGLMKGDAGEEIAVVAISMINQRTADQVDKDGGVRFTINGFKDNPLSMAEGNSLMIVGCLSESGETWHSSIPVGPDGIITNQMILDLPVQDHLGNYSNDWVVNTLFPFAMTTLAIMGSREEFVNTPETFRKMAKGKDGPRESWSPRILGKNYKIVTEGMGKSGGGRRRRASCPLPLEEGAFQVPALGSEECEHQTGSD